MHSIHKDKVSNRTWKLCSHSRVLHLKLFFCGLEIHNFNFELVYGKSNGTMERACEQRRQAEYAHKRRPGSLVGSMQTKQGTWPCSVVSTPVPGTSPGGAAGTGPQSQTAGDSSSSSGSSDGTADSPCIPSALPCHTFTNTLQELRQ